MSYFRKGTGEHSHKGLTERLTFSSMDARSLRSMAGPNKQIDNWQSKMGVVETQSFNYVLITLPTTANWEIDQVDFFSSLPSLVHSDWNQNLDCFLFLSFSENMQMQYTKSWVKLKNPKSSERQRINLKYKSSTKIKRSYV